VNRLPLKWQSVLFRGGLVKILMFSMTPLFPRHSMGGAQRQLKNVALHLANIGHEVRILCTKRPDANQPFYWHDRLQIIPIFRFKQPYPEPYATPVYNIAAAIQDIGEYLLQADRYYSHDGGLIFPYVYQDIPTTISLRSILFSETLQSAFLFQGDALILPSEHTLRSYQQTVGRFFPNFRNRAKAIYNGLDWNWFKPTPTEQIQEIITADLEGYDVALYPHRPDDDKGILWTIELADLLVHTHQLNRLRLLIPKWIDDKVSAGVREYYNELRADIHRRGLDDYFIFHDWIPDDLMPEYYSLGAVTLCLGSYVETFGNVPYESLGCGTPVILSRVGPARDILPEHLVDKIDYGDITTAAERAAAIIRERRRTSSETLNYLRQYFSLEKMVTQYADTILNVPKREPMMYQLNPISENTRFILPAWCYVSRRGIYHDFRAKYDTTQELMRLVERYPDGFTFGQAGNHDRVMAWYRDGYLVPQE
jgi:glycosyltransferase involved in cell wall biosynthesis